MRKKKVYFFSKETHTHMNENKKKAVGQALLNRMGVTQYENWLKNRGLPPKGDGPKIISAAFKLYGPPLGRVQLVGFEQQRISGQLTTLGVNVDYTLGLLTDIMREMETAARPVTPKKPNTPKNEFEHTKLKMTMFNAVVESSSQNISLVDDVVIKAGPPYTKKTYSNGYSVEVLKVTMRGGRFKKLAEFSKEYVLANNLESKISSVDFNVRISNGTQTNGVSVTIYENGKIRLSGGYLDVLLGQTNTANAKLRPLVEQPETIRRHIVDNYTTKAKFTNRRFDFNNLAGVFKIDKRILLPQTLRKYGGGSKYVNYQDDRPPPVLKLKLEGVTVGASFMGVVQLKGMKKPDDVVKQYNTVIDTIASNFVLGAAIANFNKGEYSKARVARRVNNKPAPEVIRRGTTCPVGRRPEPYSFQGKCRCPKNNPCYVKPNPQGQPCCYHVPKKIRYSQNQVRTRYNQANVKVPQNVKNRFRINNSANNKNNNIGSDALNITVVVDPKVGLKINSRQCSRYTKVGLIDIAKRLGIVDIRATAEKGEICESIKARAQILGLNKTREAAGAMAIKIDDKAIFGSGRDLKLGRRRCETYDKKDLLRMGRKAGIAGLDTSMSKKEICEEFEKYAVRKRAERKNRAAKNNQERAEKTKRLIESNLQRRQEREQKIVNERRDEIAARLGITRDAIRRDIPQLYGRRFMRRYGEMLEPYMEAQVSMIANVLKATAFNMTKQGLPSKRDVNAVKKNSVKKLRGVLEPEFYKLTILPKNNNVRANLKRILGPNFNVPSNFINTYRQHVRKRAINRGPNGQFVSAKNLERAKRSWLHIQREYGALKPRTPTPPRMTSARARELGIKVENI